MPPIVITQQLLPDKFSPVIATDIGPSYDLLLATRDGKPLPCRNRDGKIVNVSQVAYMTTIDRNIIQHEETELQHKDRLIQLATSSLIDRELDQWVQNTQGDWSGGTLQRVYTGPNSDPTKYYDGLGVNWPVLDYLPQQPFQPDPIFPETGLPVSNIQVAGGDRGSGSEWTIVYRQGANFVSDTFVNPDPPRSSSKIFNPMGSPYVSLLYAIGRLWSVDVNTANTVTIRTGFGVTPFATIAATPPFSTGIAAAEVGNNQYLAVAWSDASNFHIRLFNWSTGTASSSSFVDLNTAANAVPVGFLGDQLIVVTRPSGGQDAWILAFGIAAGTWTTLAKIENTTSTYAAVVAGGVFILAENQNATVAGTETRMYLLQGNQLQDIGILQPLSSGQTVGFLLSVSKPIAFGTYAIFAVTYLSPIDGRTRLAVYFYDVLRGKFFKGAELGPSQSVDQAFLDGQPLAITLPGWTKIGGTIGANGGLDPLTGNDILSQWSVIVPVGPTGSGTPVPVAVQELCFTAQARPSTTSEQPNVPPVQNGYQYISSIIDFTSSQPKLYRRLIARFTPLAAHSSVSVTLDAWLDQDPGRLNATPDFSATINGGDIPRATKLSLQINRIAVKLIYRLTVTGGTVLVPVPIGLLSTQFFNAPKMTGGVSIQISTGFVQTLTLDLAPNLQSNSKSIMDIWAEQRIDHVVAYNFIRQLWRLNGGEVTATFPNGDSGPWLLQDAHFDSPKPFGTVFRADQLSQGGFKWIASIKLREDIA